MDLTGRFIIDGYDLYEAFRVVVQEAQGLDVLPKVKKRTERDWPEESGVDVDATTDLTYEAHDITLDCYVKESNYADAVKRINGVVKLLSSDGLHLLGSQLRQRLYPVLLQEVTGYKRITPASASAIYVQFTLKLRCPMPETRIGNATVEADEEVALVVPTGKDFTVWWGDGTVNENTLTHTYTEAGTYTVLIAGTGVTSVVITGINVAEFSYPATGDITHVDVSHTSEEAYQRAVSIESGLKSDNNGGSVPASVYTWFKALYASLVDSFVMSYIIGGLTILKDLATRVLLLEDKYILKYVVPVDSSSIELTQDKYGNNFNFVEGDEITIYFPIMEWIGVDPKTSRVNVRFNNNSNNIYYEYSSFSINYLYSVGANYYSQKTLLFFSLINKEIQGFFSSTAKNSLTTVLSQTYPFYTDGLNSESINSILIYTSNSLKIPAGTVILIKKK